MLSFKTMDHLRMHPTVSLLKRRKEHHLVQPTFTNRSAGGGEGNGAVERPFLPARARPVPRLAPAALLAAADGAVAIRSAALPCPARLAGRHPLPADYARRPEPARRRAARRAAPPPRPVDRRDQCRLLRVDGLSLRLLHAALPGAALVRQNHSDHLPRRARHLPLPLLPGALSPRRGYSITRVPY